MRIDIRDHRSHVAPATVDEMISDVTLMDVPRRYQTTLSLACEQLEAYKELLEAMYLDSLYNDNIKPHEGNKS